MSTQLTPEQLVKIEEAKTYWLGVGRSTARCDRELTEASLVKLYAMLNRPAPIFEWYDSPRAAMQCRGKKMAKEIFNARGSIWWLTWYMHCHSVIEITGIEVSKEVADSLAIWIDLIRSAHWWFTMDTHCFLSERPVKLDVDDNGALHCVDGPAIAYADGYSLYSWHGTRVPAEWIEDRSNLDPSIALTWQNIEQRRAAAEIIGWDKVLAGLQVRVIDKDSNSLIGELIETRLPESDVAERFLRVKCATGRDFVLCVPPDTATARAAQLLLYPGMRREAFENPVRT